MVLNLRINIPDELASRAKLRGISVEAYVEEILKQQFAINTEPRHRTPDEIRLWAESLAQFSEKIPPLPEVISREWLYQDHE